MTDAEELALWLEACPCCEIVDGVGCCNSPRFEQAAALLRSQQARILGYCSSECRMRPELENACEDGAMIAMERDRLRAALENAPHGNGCPAIYSKDAPSWMNQGICTCWKSKVGALAGEQDE